MSQSESTLKAAEARRAIADTQLKRAEALFKSQTLTQADVEKAQVVTGPRRRVRGHAKTAGDAGRHGRTQVAQDAVEIETTEHVNEVTDGV